MRLTADDEPLLREALVRQLTRSWPDLHLRGRPDVLPVSRSYLHLCRGI